jgi:hypothetical protein
MSIQILIFCFVIENLLKTTVINGLGTKKKMQIYNT